MVSTFSIFHVVTVGESDTIIYIITGAVNKFVTTTTVTTVVCNLINAYSVDTWITYEAIFIGRSRLLSLFQPWTLKSYTVHTTKSIIYKKYCMIYIIQLTQQFRFSPYISGKIKITQKYDT